MFFLITATTFSSLGVVLPAMIGELHWSWGGAGSGFSLLGVAAGITATIPASLIRRFGVRVTLVVGKPGDGGGLCLPGADARSAAVFPGLSADGPGLHASRHRAGHLSAGAPVRQSVLCLWALFHRRRPGRRGGTGALSLGRGADAELARLLAGLAGDRPGGGAVERRSGGCRHRCARRLRAAIPISPRKNGR